ncbi:histidine-type phosphatase [Sphingomonas gellani]|uniref:histidine-type phosphatase n=1 Tax=Sphingomonas gellani TaxID=1166340 RepID=UPI000A915A62|nr:histidine-type phosphatase [Sphingomonas gellani]
MSLAALFAISSRAETRPRLVLERAVLVMRHGIRAPLNGEVPEGTRSGTPWPRWPVAPSRITPHGERALAMAAAGYRRLLAAQGLLMRGGCPRPGRVRIRANSSDRTIASGEAFVRGFAPGCALAVEHRPLGEADPIFEPLRARATRFDPRQAVASINRETGGMTALVARHKGALALLDRMLGCRAPVRGCVPAAAATVTASADGQDITRAGPIRASSGIAQVLQLEYAEGLPRPGWARTDPATLERLGALHAALFSVFTRPSYMAAHQAAVLGREVLAALSDTGHVRFDVLMGHDTNVTALAAALRVDLKAPGYATNDVPPGGALFFERLRDIRSGLVYIRASYRTQPLRALRSGTVDNQSTLLRIPGCATDLCRANIFYRRLRSNLADTIVEM